MRSRTIPLAAAVIAVVSLLAAASATAARHTLRPTIAGTWAGSYSGAFTGRFTLTWKKTGARLSGTIALSNPPGRYGINGSVGRGGSIHFGVVKVGATYTGTWSGKSMSGRYNSPQGGGSWSARKSS
jgi:hypothetical protein